MRHYLLSSTCIIACQANVIGHMLQQLILSGKIRKWAYALIEYDLAYEPIKSMKRPSCSVKDRRRRPEGRLMRAN
jgi:hypothetical protein